MALRRMLLPGIAIASFIAVLQTRAAESPTGSEQPELTIRQLHARLAELEERVQQLEGRWPSPIVPAAGVLPPGVGSGSRRSFDPSEVRVPPTWKPGEINGLRYYIVPLGRKG
jgi:hypothetical protein